MTSHRPLELDRAEEIVANWLDWIFWVLRFRPAFEDWLGWRWPT